MKKKQRGPGPPFMSQGGEDVLALRLFRKIGVRSQCAVEFGAVDGLYKSNTAYFRDVLGWRVVLFDSDPRGSTVHSVHRAAITAENINRVFAEHGVPDDLDLLSIDIDGNDLWVWKALTYQPSVVIIEYNPKWKAHRRRTVPYDPARNGWDKTDYYGASAGALVELGKQKGYMLAAATHYNLLFAPAGSVEPYQLREVKTRNRHDRPDPLERPWVGYP